MHADEPGWLQVGQHNDHLYPARLVHNILEDGYSRTMLVRTT